jgi:hypothetical protein
VFTPGIDSAFNRNEYQRISLGVRARPVYKADVIASTSHNLVALDSSQG